MTYVDNYGNVRDRATRERVTAVADTPSPETVLGALVGGSDGIGRMIESQEAEGARAVLESTLIPTDRGARMGREGDEEWEALGFVFGEQVPDDPLFQHVTLPEGWTREGTGHSLHTSILDTRGVKRVGIGYKAAFYDRWASAHLVNVGGAVAQHVIYGYSKDESEPVTALLYPLDVLTEAEKADAVEALRKEWGRSLAYGREDRHLPRIMQGLALLGVTDAEPIEHDGRF